jgi:D-methionine transport system ATP-binding protein
MRPAVLLTDEPTSALDPETTASVLNLLRQIREDFQVTILLITHELDAVRAVCDRVAVLEAGRVAEEGSVEDVLLKPTSSAAKRLLRSELGVMQIPSDQSQASPGATSVLVELQIIGAATSEPILSQLIQTYHIEVNILRGHIDRLNTTPYGFLLVQLSGEQQAVAQSMATLTERGIGVVRVNNAGVPI